MNRNRIRGREKQIPDLKNKRLVRITFYEGRWWVGRENEIMLNLVIFILQDCNIIFLSIICRVLPKHILNKRVNSHLGEMYITTKMRLELHRQDTLRTENTSGKNAALFAHLQSPTLNRVESESIKHNISPVYHHMEDTYKEQTLRE